jgi:hypothetical protein
VASLCANGGGACQVNSSTATCASGTVVGGGWDSVSPDLVVPYAKRVGPNTYTVIAVNYSTSAQTVTAQAICASGPGLVGAAAPAGAAKAFAAALSQEKDMLSR